MSRLVLLLGLLLCGCTTTAASPVAPAPSVTGTALSAAQALRVTQVRTVPGYRRAAFGPSWADVDHNGCDTRDDVLRRDLTGITTREGTHGCVVLSGTLHDPYTGATIAFSKSRADRVQIDHVVALADAWRSGAAGWGDARRLAFANDPLDLLAVDGPTNQDKSDDDASRWLPAPRSSRCPYAARQVAVKAKYALTVTGAERDALVQVLSGCPEQALP